MTVPALTLNNGVQIPQLGFGVFLVPDTETRPPSRTALQAGYRHIDTAKLYQNEAGVGAAIAESGIARDELFVTTKVWNSEQGFDPAIASFEASMDRLGLDVLDLLLIHWPAPDLDRYVDTWRAFEKLYADGRVRAIGVSNFHPAHLRRLLDETAWCRRSTRSSCTRCCRRTSCAPSTPSTASSPRPGRRWPAAARC